MSVSYEAVIKCFPDLQDPRQAYKVDLRLLKERMNEVFLTLQTKLVRRTVLFREPGGTLRRVRLETKNPNLPKPVFSAQWETVSETGGSEIWEDPKLKRQGVTAEDIRGFLGTNLVERDESVEIDTKLKDAKLTSRRDLTKILELRLEDKGALHTLNCEDKQSIGTICTCFKK